MNRAVIDIGSNSVRLMLDEGKFLNSKFLATTQIAEGLNHSGKLNAEAMERTSEAVKEFCSAAKTAGAEKIYIFATEAVRAAANSAEFAKTVTRKTGLPVDIIDGSSEAELGFLGAAENGVLSTVIDVGGASVEIVTGTVPVVDYSCSLAIGVVRLKEMFGANYTGLQKKLAVDLQEYGNLIPSEAYIAVGGTAGTLGAINLNLTGYDPARVHGATLTLAGLKKTEALLKVLAPEEIMAKHPFIGARRATVITHGAILLRMIMEYAGISSLTVSERDNLEGYLKKHAGI